MIITGGISPNEEGGLGAKLQTTLVVGAFEAGELDAKRAIDQESRLAAVA